MANSKVASLTELEVNGGNPIGDVNRRASVLSSELEWEGGLCTPSTRRSLSQNGSFCDATVRDPEAILRGLMSCGVDASEAMKAVMKYYEAAIVATDGSPSSAVSESSSTSRRSVRTELWRNEMGSMPDRPGYCYLHVVRWARRKYVGAALGVCPTMQAFISHISPEDLDVDLSNKISVYRLPNAHGGMSVAYHMAETCEIGVRVGSFREVMQTMLHTYPYLNSGDFGVDKLLTVKLPVVGRFAVCNDDASSPVSVSGAVLPSPITDSNLDDVLRRTVVTKALEVIPALRVGGIPVVSDQKASVAGSLQFPDLQFRRAELSALALSSNEDDLPPLVSDSGLSFSFDDAGYSVIVTLSNINSGSDIHIPVLQSGAGFWLFQPGSVDTYSHWRCDDVRMMSNRNPCCFMRQAEFAREELMFSAVKSTVLINIAVSAASDMTSYVWRALSDSGMIHVFAVDAFSSAVHEFQSYESVVENLDRPVSLLARVLSGVMKQNSVRPACEADYVSYGYDRNDRYRDINLLTGS